MARGGMALLTQKRGPPGQRGRVVTAVHVVTQGAVISDRSVFPQERATFFCVTGITSVIDVVFCQQEVAVAVVHVVAVAAAHIAKAQRMTGSLVDVRTLALVAIERMRLAPGHFSVMCYSFAFVGWYAFTFATATEVSGTPSPLRMVTSKGIWPVRLCVAQPKHGS